MIQHAVKLSAGSIPMSVDALISIFTSHFPPQRELVCQIFKYAVSEFDKPALQHVVETVKELTLLTPNFMTLEMVETGVWRTIESLEDIKLDCPNARELMEFTLQQLNDKGLLTHSQPLFKYLGRERLPSQDLNG